MPSTSLHRWQQSRRVQLDAIVEAHRAAGRAGRGRHAADQVIYAYTLLLSSQFQAFCRDLHSECIQHIVQNVPATLRNVLRGGLLGDRKLDRGNPTPGHIGADFGRLGLSIWEDSKALDSGTGSRQKQLDELNKWRNAIAHQDFDAEKLGGRINLRLSEVSAWRRTCNQLARSFDSRSEQAPPDSAGSSPMVIDF